MACFINSVLLLCLWSAKLLLICVVSIFRGKIYDFFNLCNFSEKFFRVQNVNVQSVADFVQKIPKNFLCKSFVVRKKAVPLHSLSTRSAVHSKAQRSLKTFHTDIAVQRSWFFLFMGIIKTGYIKYRNKNEPSIFQILGINQKT